MSKGLLKTSDTVSQRLLDLVSKGKDPRAFLARKAYPIYQSHQQRRWMTEGRSEDSVWPKLSKKYEDYKKRKFSSLPGAGTKMLIVSGSLYESVSGKKFGTGSSNDSQTEPSSARGHRVLLSERSMTISTEINYAKYVADVRTMFFFSQRFKKEIRDKYINWMAGAA